MTLKPPDARPVPVDRRGQVPTVHMVGYAHLDPVWLWPWTEGYAEARATLRSAVDRMAEFPEFVFTATSVQFLSWVEESDPELFDEIGKRVAEGRFHLAGGWWVEPDCNIPSGEAFARQGLYAQRWLADRFGVISTVGGNPDSFGHAATLPMILRGCGLDGYVFVRPQPHELGLPGHAFTWRAPDGSQVGAYRLHCYSSERNDLEEHVNRSLGGSDRGAANAMVFYGVGNHGGGPTIANLVSLRQVAASSPRRIVCSSPRSYLDALYAQDGRPPSHDGELQHHARGCYAAHAGIKRWNRQAEGALLVAERWASVARAVSGLAYPRERLTEAWQTLMLNQFHDTLAGTAVESAYDDARNQLGAVLDTAQRVANAAIQRVASRVAIPFEEGMLPLVVANVHPWPVRQVVEFEVGGGARRMDLVDDEGNPVPLQWGGSEATLGAGRYRAVFVADLPPLGYRTYRFRWGQCQVAPMPLPKPTRKAGGAETVLENARLRFSVDARTGAPDGLLNKDAGVDVLAGARGPHAVVVRDESDTWGHDRTGFTDELGAFTVDSVERYEHGPARSVLRVRSRYGTSTLIEDYALGRDDGHVEVAVTLDWHEPAAVCKLRYPTALVADAARPVRASAPFGSVDRAAQGDEEPMHGWVDATGSLAGAAGARVQAGLAVLNDGKYSYDVRTDPGTGRLDVGLTVARSVVYAFHAPARLTPGADYRRLDLGEQRFALRLAAHAGDWSGAELPRLAVELNQRPVVVRETFHEGPLPMAGSFAQVSGDGVLATAIKRGEDGDAVVVRVVETTGRDAVAHVVLGFAGREFDLPVPAHGVVTVRVPDDPQRPPVPVDLLEWTDEERPAGQPGQTFEMLMPGLL